MSATKKRRVSKLKKPKSELQQQSKGGTRTAENTKNVKVVKTAKLCAKTESQSLQSLQYSVDDLKPGQKYPTPSPAAGLRVFYETLLEQNKDSLMALKWCVEYGVHPKGVDPTDAMGLLKQRLAQHKKQQKQSDSAKNNRKTKKPQSSKRKKRSGARATQSHADANDFMSAADVGLAVDSGGFTEDMHGGAMGF